MKGIRYSSTILLLVFLVFSDQMSFAQANDNVPSATSEEYSNTFDFAPGVNALQKPSSWWKARTESSPENRASWLGLYQSEYYQALRSEGKEFKSSTQNELTDIEERLKALSKDSYEYHAVAYQNRFLKEEGRAHLIALDALRPNGLEWLDDLAAYAIFDNNDALAKRYLVDLKKNGVYPQALLAYHRKTLMSLPPSSVLLTHGNTDTYPLLILQRIDGLRKDVTIVSTDHLKNDSYREKTLELLGVGNQVEIPDQPYIALEILSQKSNRPLHVSLTFPAFWLKGHANSLYFKGLSYQWSPEVAVFGGFEAISFYESQLKDVNFNISHPVNRNYLPILIKAYEQAKIRSSNSLENEIKEKLILIANQSKDPNSILNKISE